MQIKYFIVLKQNQKIQNEEMRKKQDKIMNTLKNLIKLGEKCK